MVNIDFLYSFILCVGFTILNFYKVGLKNKTYVLPSTFFSMMWGLSCLGGFLYSNLIIGETDYYLTASYLEDISSYQLYFIVVAFAAFFLARYRKRKVCLEITDNFGNADISIVRRKMRWVLYVFFAIGMYRLISVMSVTGFDYAAMRAFYLGTRSHFSVYDSNLIRIASYLSQLANFYVCVLGMETALRGVHIKPLVRDFLLFIPFHMSFGGRLFILAFFAPFIFSYLLSFSIKSFVEKKVKFDKKFALVLLSPVLLVIFVQILKMDEMVSMNAFEEYSTEIFYTSSCYIHLNELWNSLPYDYSLGYGANCLGVGSSVYNHILEAWGVDKNVASVCIPSVIPQAYLDFGRNGSLLFFFIVFYFLEAFAMSSLKQLTTRKMLIIVLLCQIAYLSASSSVFDCLRSFIVGYIALVLFVQMTELKIVRRHDNFFE